MPTTVGMLNVIPTVVGTLNPMNSAL